MSYSAICRLSRFHPARNFLLAAFLGLATTISLPAQDNVATRFALVTAGSPGALDALTALVEVEISKHKSIVLLERQEIIRILSEHELSLAQPIEADTAIKVGKLVNVDIFVVLDPFSVEHNLVRVL